MNSNVAKAEGGHPFATRRPEIVIAPEPGEPFDVDCRELRWWFAVPEVGDRTLWAIYDPPEWKLTSVTEMEARCLARVHGVEGVEIAVNEWQPGVGWRYEDWIVYGRLTDDTIQWLATINTVNDKRILRTFLDEGFGRDWGEAPRRLTDQGRYAQTENGSYVQRHHRPDAIGASLFSVMVNNRNFTCLRVLDLDGEASETGILVEAYLTEEGRSILFRRYNGRLWSVDSAGPHSLPWDERFPQNARLVIDGVTYVHWYDCLTHLAVTD